MIITMIDASPFISIDKAKVIASKLNLDIASKVLQHVALDRFLMFMEDEGSAATVANRVPDSGGSIRHHCWRWTHQALANGVVLPSLINIEIPEFRNMLGGLDNIKFAKPLRMDQNDSRLHMQLVILLSVTMFCLVLTSGYSCGA